MKRWKNFCKKHPEVNACKFHAKSIHTIKNENSPCHESNRIYLMNDDTKAFFFRATLIKNETLKQEKGRIDIHYYSIGNDEIAFTELALLRRAAKAGVEIRIVVDGLATYSSNEDKSDKKSGLYIKGILKNLIKNGVTIKTHHDPFIRPAKINSRNHSKILKFSQTVIIGDRNLRNENYNTTFNKGKKYIGFDVIVKGDILHEMETYLEQFWRSPRLQEQTYSHVNNFYEKWGKDTLDRIEEEDSLNLFGLHPEEINEFYEKLNGKFVRADYLEWIFDRDNSSSNIKVKSLSGMDKMISAIYRADKTIKIVAPYMILTNRMKNA